MDASKINEIIDEFNEQANEAACLAFIARDASLQRACVANLQVVQKNIEAARRQAASERDCNAANFLLGLRCAARAFASELQVYLLLKDSEPEEAWDALIETQDAFGAALRAHARFAHLEPLARRARDLEASLFPPQMFLSAGMIVRKQVCSICEEDYFECDHLAGMPYCGEFCAIQLMEIEADHVAFVDEPANRRCRVTAFSVPGGTRNRMTWAVIPGEPKQPPEGAAAENGSVVEGINGTFPGEDIAGTAPAAAP
jgi:hypothetical protein